MSTKKTGSASTLASPLAQNRMRSVIGPGGASSGAAGGGASNAASAAAAAANLRPESGLAGGSSFLRTEGSTRGPNAGGGNKNPNFNKMVSQRSMRHGGGKGHRGAGGDDSGSGRRSRKKKKDDHARVIFDGRDVTPQPLTFYGNAASMAASIATQLAGTAAAGGVVVPGGDAGASGVHTLEGADTGLGALAHGGMSTISTADSESGSGAYMSYHQGLGGLEGSEWGGGLAARLGMQFEYATDGAGHGSSSAQPAKAREWSDKELREKHTIKIEETATITLLHIPSTRIFDEDEPEQLAKDLKANKHYLQVLEKHKEKDKYTARLVQTLNNSLRDKEVQVAPPATRSVGAEASTWDLFDVEQRVNLQITAASLAINGTSGGGGGGGNSRSTSTSTSVQQQVPRIQHESDLIARTAHLAKTVAAAAAAAGAAAAGGAARNNAGGAAGGANGTGGEEEDDEGYSASMRGGGAGGARGSGAGGAGTDTNTPMGGHSAAQSFHRGGGSGAVGGSAVNNASFRGGAGKGSSNLSWHQGLFTGGSQRNIAGAHAATGSTTSTVAAGGAATGGAHSSVVTRAGGGPGGVAGGVGGGRDPSAALLDKLFAKPSFPRALRALEQAVLQTSLHGAQLLYRNHPEATEADIAALMGGQDGSDGINEDGEGAGGDEASKKEEADLMQHGAGSSLLPPVSSLGVGGGIGGADKDDANGAAEAGSAGSAQASSHGQQISLGSASLIPLWKFSCPLTAGLSVSCLSWNKQNLDLLAAGYGSSDFGHASRDRRTGQIINGIRVPEVAGGGRGGQQQQQPQAAGGGMICFWSLKNPSFPSKVFYTAHAVSSLDFSDEHPHLLAAGLYDGSVAIFDIRDEGFGASKAALQSQHQTGKHSEAVWGVKWVCKELHKRSQQLTSISTDGSVKQWSMKKGLVPHELMQLKRIPNRAALQSAGTSGGSNSSTMEGISRDASGLCFDFPPTDGTQYYAGTEEGLIHRCSVSYNEQTLDNFYGHTGPVYRVRCSPFLSDAFLSCSADWSAMLWSQRSSGSNGGGKAVLKFSGGHDAVQDIAWSPNVSTMFALVSREGRVEVWDLDVSPLDPIVKMFLPTSAVAAPAAQKKELTAADKTAATVAAATPSLHAEGTSSTLDSPSKATTASPSSSQQQQQQQQEASKRYLTCLSFNAHAPVLLVGTSDGCIELFRMEGTALTSVPPPAEVLASLDPAQLAQLAAQSFGQELNAEKVMQVPRDRERDNGNNNGQPSTAVAIGGANGDEKSQLQLQQEQLAKFREQGRRLEAIMEQHVDSKNKLQGVVAAGASSASGGGAAAANGNSAGESKKPE